MDVKLTFWFCIGLLGFITELQIGDLSLQNSPKCSPRVVTHPASFDRREETCECRTIISAAGNLNFPLNADVETNREGALCPIQSQSAFTHCTVPLAVRIVQVPTVF